MKAIPQYIANKNDPEHIKYKHPLLESLLNVTYGTIIYQEQVMGIVQKLAGFSLGQADIIRRAMGKKNVDEMKRQRLKFIYGDKDENGNVLIEGALARGVPEEVAADIFDEMADFAKYAFNKSHAAAYAVLAYQTAYLKALYPQEFLAAVLNNRITNIVEITKYVMYLKERDIKVLPPDINKSKQFFSVENYCVRIGLVAIKGVGHAAIESIIDEREKNGEFTSFEDFIARSDIHALNRRLVENLILAGAFDQFGVSRAVLVEVCGELIDMAAGIAKQKESCQISLFGTVLEETPLHVDYPNIPEFDTKTKLSKEKEVLGVYISGHPLENYMEKFHKFSFSCLSLAEYEEDEEGNRTYPDLEDGTFVTMGGMITAINKKVTKNGANMAFITVEDVYGGIEVVLFPKVYDRYKDKLEIESIVEISGRLQLRDGEKPAIALDKIKIFDDGSGEEEKTPAAPAATVEKVKTPKEYLCIVLNGDDAKLKDEIIDTVEQYPGNMITYLKIDGKNYVLRQGARNCKGLFYELAGLVDEKNIKYALI